RPSPSGQPRVVPQPAHDAAARVGQPRGQRPSETEPSGGPDKRDSVASVKPFAVPRPFVADEGRETRSAGPAVPSSLGTTVCPVHAPRRIFFLYHSCHSQ